MTKERGRLLHIWLGFPQQISINAKYGIHDEVPDNMTEFASERQRFTVRVVMRESTSYR